MSEFREISPFEKRKQYGVREESNFVASSIGENYMKLEFDRQPDRNVNRTIKFTEKTER